MSGYDQVDEADSGWVLNKEISDSLAFRVSDVSVTFKTVIDKRLGLKSALMGMGRQRREVREVQALKNVSFEVAKGTVLGVIGHNGAGKSTLLRGIAGILPPTQGEIEVRGQVSTLLSLGVGFNSALSGHENIMLAGLASGRSRDEVLAMREDIVAFAEIGDFIDFPIRTYSKGMGQRLAFSVAVHMEPQILLVDEALSAGDAQFKVKAQKAMNAIMENAHTLVLVSHALGTVKELCNDAIWMDHGRLIMRGKPDEVIDAYTEQREVGQSAAVLEDF